MYFEDYRLSTLQTLKTATRLFPLLFLITGVEQSFLLSSLDVSRHFSSYTASDYFKLLEQHAGYCCCCCNGVSKAWKLKYVNEVSHACLSLQFFARIFDLQIIPSPFCFRLCIEMLEELELDWIRVPREHFNSSDNFITSAIFVQTKYCLCFGKPSHFPPLLYFISTI